MIHRADKKNAISIQLELNESLSLSVCFCKHSNKVFAAYKEIKVLLLFKTSFFLLFWCQFPIAVQSRAVSGCIAYKVNAILFSFDLDSLTFYLHFSAKISYLSTNKNNSVVRVELGTMTETKSTFAEKCSIK